MVRRRDGSSLRAVPFVHDVAVRWGELDPYNHVNHAVYFTYCEAARVAMLDEAGWSMTRLTDEGCRIVVTEVNARFLRSASEGQTLQVTTDLAEARRVSATWRQVITHAGAPVFDALVTAAFTTLEGRPTRAPAGFFDAVRQP
jgi:acyl-CoA thioester hydrolase